MIPDKLAVRRAFSKLDKLDASGKLAAPVDHEVFFGNGYDEIMFFDGHAKLSTRRGTLISADVKLKDWRLAANVVVTGSITASSIHLTRSLLVLGDLVVRGDVRGVGEPHTLTVLGEVKIGRAITEAQYIMQFLGGGTIDTLVDEDGGGEELLELLGRKLKVKHVSDRLPR